MTDSGGELSISRWAKFRKWFSDKIPNGEKADVIWSIWPIIAFLAIAFALWFFLGSGHRVIDSRLWPSYFEHCFRYLCKDGKCVFSNTCQVDAVRFSSSFMIAVATASILPLLNGYGYFSEIRDGAEKGDAADTSVGHKNAVRRRKFAMGIAILAFMLNVLWLFNVYAWDTIGGHANEYFILSLFAAYGVVDILLMINYQQERSGLIAKRIADSTSASTFDIMKVQIRCDFFFGNLLFIDLPVVAGVLLVFLVSGNFPTEGLHGDTALMTGATIMHVAFSQLVFCMLLLQLNLKRYKLSQFELGSTQTAFVAAAQ